jgi:hypothetical protein
MTFRKEVINADDKKKMLHHDDGYTLAQYSNKAINMKVNHVTNSVQYVVFRTDIECSHTFYILEDAIKCYNAGCPQVNTKWLDNLKEVYSTYVAVSIMDCYPYDNGFHFISDCLFAVYGGRDINDSLLSLEFNGIDDKGGPVSATSGWIAWRVPVVIHELLTASASYNGKVFARAVIKNKEVITAWQPIE